MKKIKSHSNFDAVKNVISGKYIGRSGVPKSLLKDSKYEQHIKKREAKYIQYAKKGELFKLGSSSALLKLSKKNLKGFFQRNSLDIRKILPQTTSTNITGSAICPICERMYPGDPTTEHVLPQSVAVEFILTPVNMVVACRDCNSTKHSSMGTSRLDTEINLYFEEYDISNNIQFDMEWRFGEYLPKISFKRTNEESAVIQSRLEVFWNIYNLGLTYTKEATKVYEGVLSSFVGKYIGSNTNKVSATILLEYLNKLNDDSLKSYSIDKRYSEKYWEYRMTNLFINNSTELGTLVDYLNRKLQYLLAI